MMRLNGRSSAATECPIGQSLDTPLSPFPQIQSKTSVNILNSYFGFNSIYKNWPELPTLVSQYPYYGLTQPKELNVWSNKSDRPLDIRRPPLYPSSQYWPSIEESFGQWPNRPQPPVYMWTSNFLDNVNKGSLGLDDNNNFLSSDMKPQSDQKSLEFDQNIGDLLAYSWKRCQTLISPNSEASVKSPNDKPLSDRLLDKQMTGESMFDPMTSIWFPQAKCRRRQPSLMECVFCKNNNERPEFYKSHILKDPDSNIQCPVLRAYNCPICQNGGGPKAHTIRYCPLNKAGLQAKIERLIKYQTIEVEDSSDKTKDLKPIKKSDPKKNQKKSRIREKSK